MLKGRHALVTGAADGIGRGIVDLFTAQGAKVIAVDIDGDKLQAAHAGNDSVTCLEQDVSAPEAAETLLAAARDAHGGLDILVNNAGIAGDFKDLPDTSDAAWRRIMAINLDAPFFITRAFVPYLIESRYGRIINTSSVVGEFAIEGLGPYTVSKHALLGLTRQLAVDLGKHGITCNAILPGNTITGITRETWSDADTPENQNYLRHASVLARFSQPSDIAGAALYLASDLAAYVTGQGLAVDGGMTCKLYSSLI